jgi:hypothetical protein
MSKSAASTTAGATLLFKVGTLGTTGDATIATLTTGTPTAAADVAHLELMATIRTIGAAATSSFAGSLRHNLATTGFSNISGECYSTTGTTFDSTVANLICGLTFTIPAAAVWTVTQVIAEAEAL